MAWTSKGSKYAPGNICRVALNRIRVKQDELVTIPAQDMRDLVSMLRNKWRYRWEWYQDIPPIKVIYSPKYTTQKIVLVDGVEQYQTARILGLDTINCQFVSESASVYGIDLFMSTNSSDTEANTSDEKNQGLSLTEKWGELHKGTANPYPECSDEPKQPESVKKEAIPAPGCWDKLRYHLFHVWCRDNESDFRTLMSWFAHLVQYPKEKPTTALLVSGDTRSVKTCVMSSIFGTFLDRYKSIYTRKALKNEQLRGIENSDILVLSVPVCSLHIKNYIRCPINKSLQRRVAKLMLDTRIAMLTDEDISEMKEMFPKHVFALSLDNEKARDSAYFNALMDEINNGGREAFLYDLIHYELEA